MMHLFRLAGILMVLGFFGCGDGKLNLPIVMWGESDTVAEQKPEPVSSSLPEIVSSSSSVIKVESSSSSEVIIESSSSSGEEPVSSSSSSREARSSSSKEYEDYPPIIPGDPNQEVRYAETTRYWDGCRPHCAYYANLAGSPLLPDKAINRTCAIDGVTEIPLIFSHPDNNEYVTRYNAVPSAWESGTFMTNDWFRSETYQSWMDANPDYRSWLDANRNRLNAGNPMLGGIADKNLSYTCFDMAPKIINDTLAYAFAAVGLPGAACGKCYRLQFVSDSWRFGSPRVTHRALKGKTLIVMANNTGNGGASSADRGWFDIMVPGMGWGAQDCFSEQFGLERKGAHGVFGNGDSGGLLAECVFPSAEDAQKYSPGTIGGSERWSLDAWQQCLRDKCHDAFNGKPKELLDGCLWHADWFMAADNPEAWYVETPCPKDLLNLYTSTLTPKLPDCYTSNPRTCQIDGM